MAEVEKCARIQDNNVPSMFHFLQKKKKTKVFNLHFKSTYLKERKKLTNNFNKN